MTEVDANLVVTVILVNKSDFYRNLLVEYEDAVS